MHLRISFLLLLFVANANLVALVMAGDFSWYANLFGFQCDAPKTEKRSRTANTHATHPQIRIPLQRNDHQLKFVRNIGIYIKKTKNSPHSKRAPLKIYEEAKPNPYPIPLTHTQTQWPIDIYLMNYAILAILSLISVLFCFVLFSISSIYNTR